MKTLLAALLMASSVWAQTAQVPNKTLPKQGPPPKHLTVRSDGHVSANQDPASPEKFELYLVKQGDTLSHIAGEVLENPRLWPQLWEQNEHIINPHWIYPNDKILIKPVTLITEAKPPEPDPTPEPQQEPPRKVQLPPPAPPAPSQGPAQPALIVEQQKPVPELKFDDLYCSGSVRTAPLPKDLKVIAKFDATGSVLATETDYVYLSQGSEDGIATGNTYQVVRPTKTLTNPNGRTKAERDLGMHYLDIAQLRVVLAQPEFSLARVIHSCADAVDVGDILLPFQRTVVPLPSRPRPFSPIAVTTSGIKGTIVSTKDVMLNFGSSFKGTRQTPGVRGGRLGSVDRGVATEGMVVYIDIGQDQAVNPGDIFLVYRGVAVDQRLYDFPTEVKKLKNTRSAIGELVVLKVGERAATALVTYAADGLMLGDSVERR
ncbi:MAG: hypothetical protein DMG14_07340 [Acidobacteria bacterium]|nr:MAG: hypothetical protein DMG14_07340 [Acidobacteriota bacterium]